MLAQEGVIDSRGLFPRSPRAAKISMRLWSHLLQSGVARSTL